MTVRYSAQVEGVLAIVGNAFNTGTVFETDEQVAALMAAADCGLIRLVQEIKPFKLYDSRWKTTVGIELTDLGLEHLGIDPVKYRKPH